MSGAAVLRVEGTQVRLSNLHKVLYPAAGFTKGDMIQYYLDVAPVLLPHVERRPITLKRYPDGVDASFFYEKRCPVHKPPWVNTARLPSDRRGSIDYCTLDSAASLVWVANLASIELHPLLCRAEAPQRPLAMVLDLDPGMPATIRDCIPVAQRLRQILEDRGLVACIKTSGGKGLHVWVPLNTPVSFEQTKSFARALALTLERNDPRHVTANMSKAGREGRVFIDWSQNDVHKTTVAVYSLRAREKPSVSTPVTWDELRAAAKSRGAGTLEFPPAKVLARIEKHGDLFADALTIKQKLPRAG